MRTTRIIRALACSAVLACLLPASAAAERSATPREWRAIDSYFAQTERSLKDTLAWVHVSTRGPFAFAYLRGGQTAAVLLTGSGTRWRAIDTVSDEGLRCGVAPRQVIAELQLERYNDGPRPCEPD